MSHQDWKPVDIGRKSGGALTNSEILMKQQQAKRNGNTISKHKTVFKNAPDNAKKLDDATESSKIDKLRHGKDIMQARSAKKMTRKQLASRLSLKEEVIAGFENNSVLATPANNQILNKIKRCLSIK